MYSDHGENLQALRLGHMCLWTTLTHDQRVSGVEAILSADEQRRARRFRRDRDRHQFIVAHALVRLALSRHFPVPAGEWQFDRDRNGKPFISAPEISPTVRFSLSHTDGLVACLITLSAEAAVDVEKMEHRSDLPFVAGQIFSPIELADLSALSGENWTKRFFDYWTLKEAYAKAQGLGLTSTSSEIGFELEPNNGIRVSHTPPIDDASAWLLWRDCARSQHAMAIAVKKDFEADCEIIHQPVKFDGVRIVPEAQARRIRLSNNNCPVGKEIHVN